MEPSIKNEHFLGYSETSEEFEIYVLGERHIEVSLDVTFHEEETFKRSKELECDIDTKEAKAPISKDHDDGSSHFDVERENPT